jgi:hypothetical protein
LSKVPAISIGVAGLMTGLFWILERRMAADLARSTQETKNEEQQSE